MEYTTLDVFAQILIGGPSILALVALFVYSDYLSDGNVERLEREEKEMSK